jgi:hypothetical protein
MNISQNLQTGHGLGSRVIMGVVRELGWYRPVALWNLIVTTPSASSASYRLAATVLYALRFTLTSLHVGDCTLVVAS